MPESKNRTSVLDVDQSVDVRSGGSPEDHRAMVADPARTAGPSPATAASCDRCGERSEAEAHRSGDPGRRGEGNDQRQQELDDHEDPADDMGEQEGAPEAPTGEEVEAAEDQPVLAAR